MRFCCICSNKDKNFKANHNKDTKEDAKESVVSVVTKIRILKQITTSIGARLTASCCICSNKDKNFKANHNNAKPHLVRCPVVSVVTKIRILKQITTLIVIDDEDT